MEGTLVSVKECDYLKEDDLERAIYYFFAIFTLNEKLNNFLWNFLYQLCTPKINPILFFLGHTHIHSNFWKRPLYFSTISFLLSFTLTQSSPLLLIRPHSSSEQTDISPPRRERQHDSHQHCRGCLRRTHTWTWECIHW